MLFKNFGTKFICIAVHLDAQWANSVVLKRTDKTFQLNSWFLGRILILRMFTSTKYIQFTCKRNFIQEFGSGIPWC